MDVGQPAPEATSVLAGLLADPLVVVDVGCRWGFADRWGRLAERCMSVGFDPDREECERLAARYADRGDSVRLVPLALGPEAGNATLYMTKDPGGYSILPTVEDVVERHPSLEGGRVQGTMPIELTTLDTWCESEAVERVDVIKIDTQGSELGVLEGADRILATVRAVEVEVEFNPLYQGVPLFSEIDRFLRERGFVLWRLRDLAHYAQRGAPGGWRVEESSWFDSDQVKSLTGSGQLFWANAYFVKESVAYPSAGAGWEELVRDACVTSALGFHDLVCLALREARASAPSEVAAALDAAGSQDSLRATHERELSDRSVELEGTLMLEVDDPAFTGWGWREPQRVDLGPVRWTGPAREASVDLPVRIGPGARIEFLAIGAMSDRILDELILEVNRVPVELTRSPHEHGVVFGANAPPDYKPDRRFTRLVLRTAETIPWSERNPDSNDDIELGLAVSWVRLTQ
jgi:FkbM family methyltransferase